MSIIRVIIDAIAALTTLCIQADAAYIEFQPVQTYVIPGAGNIQYARFNDLDLDHSPEVLVIDTNKLVLYSPTLDSVLFSLPLSEAGLRHVIFDDVNRDDVPDIVEGHIDYETYARITIVDGLSIWSGTPASEFREFAITQVSVWSSGMLGLLKATDINADGKNEFLFSYDTAYTDNWYSYFFDGFTRSYYSFPDSLLRVSPDMFLSFEPLGGDIWLTSRYSGYYRDLMGGSFSFTADLYLYDAKTQSRGGIVVKDEMGVPVAPTDGSIRFTAPICVGNMITDIPGNEILVSTTGELQTGGPIPEHTEIGELQMYQYIAPDSLASIWQMDMFPLPQQILAQGGFSGHYLGFVVNTLNLYKGADGSVAYSTTDVPAGRHQWVYPFDDGLPYLAIMNADTVALYSLAVSTAVYDGGEDVAIPNILAIGTPHPNPFNATQTIPITAKPGKHLTVDVYNLLGQKVAIIFDGRVTTAQLAIPWKADQLPSGIYFIRATSEDEAVTVKSILVK
ncbi:MAG: T9SS type A sorting domain-containing protein [candidate division Zixibacteria bacterium]|nr:T9SS type A sorting domain-containing protein [candidate division Zixibacteria bacterium]